MQRCSFAHKFNIFSCARTRDSVARMPHEYCKGTAKVAKIPCKCAAQVVQRRYAKRPRHGKGCANVRQRVYKGLQRQCMHRGNITNAVQMQHGSCKCSKWIKMQDYSKMQNQSNMQDCSILENCNTMQDLSKMHTLCRIQNRCKIQEWSKMQYWREMQNLCKMQA